MFQNKSSDSIPVLEARVHTGKEARIDDDVLAEEVPHADLTLEPVEDPAVGPGAVEIEMQQAELAAVDDLSIGPDRLAHAQTHVAVELAEVATPIVHPAVGHVVDPGRQRLLEAPIAFVEKLAMPRSERRVLGRVVLLHCSRGDDARALARGQQHDEQGQETAASNPDHRLLLRGLYRMVAAVHTRNRTQ